MGAPSKEVAKALPCALLVGGPDDPCRSSRASRTHTGSRRAHGDPSAVRQTVTGRSSRTASIVADRALRLARASWMRGNRSDRMTSAGKQAHARALQARYEPVAVMFNLVQPTGPGWRNAGGNRDTRLDEARWRRAYSRQHGPCRVMTEAWSGRKSCIKLLACQS